ncbi:hypothetical protein [Nocardioides sp.]|uniref:hypothetical protein n=1 Tax=Nocardioides sp. TaxID=35761 RepID=UPI003527D007
MSNLARIRRLVLGAVRIPAFLGLALVLPGCSSDNGLATREVTRDGYGSTWPLTVDRAVLACEPGEVPTVTVKGRSFGLRETSTDLPRGLLRIWADDPATGQPMDPAPLLDDALALCD